MKVEYVMAADDVGMKPQLNPAPAAVAKLLALGGVAAEGGFQALDHQGDFPVPVHCPEDVKNPFPAQDFFDFKILVEQISRPPGSRFVVFSLQMASVPSSFIL
jgi:hypothetical protein